MYCGTFRSFTAELEFRYPIRDHKARHRLVARRLKKERWRPLPQHSPNCKPHGNNRRLSHRHQRSPRDATSTLTEPTGKTNRHQTEPAGFGPLAADAGDLLVIVPINRNY